MGLYIIAAILLLPLIEIAMFIWVGGLIGVFPTILLTVITALAGTVMLRQQGLSLLMRMQTELDAGRTPGNEVMQGAMIVLASILLLIPGFVTDAIGLLLFIPVRCAKRWRGSLLPDRTSLSSMAAVVCGGRMTASWIWTKATGAKKTAARVVAPASRSSAPGRMARTTRSPDFPNAH